MINVKRTIFSTVLLVVSMSFCQAQIYLPRESAAAMLTQRIGITKVTIEYSRPQVIKNGQDRTGKLWGQQVWYGYRKINFAGKGEIPWRAGANENTKISFSTDVNIEGKPLKAGTYGFHIALAEDGQETLIFSKNATSWGSFEYTPEEDALRVNINSQPHAFTNILSYDFEEIGPNHGLVVLTWEKKKFPFRIDVDTKQLVLTEFRTKLPQLNAPQHYLTAARYCFRNNTNHDEALTWVEKAMKDGKNFNNLTIKAGLLLQREELPASIAITDEAAQLADINQLNALGYQMLQLKQAEKAVEYFQLNVERNPKDANVYDSLGEGYVALGEKKKAIKSFKKSLSLNPADNVKQNSMAQLKKLGVEYED